MSYITLYTDSNNEFIYKYDAKWNEISRWHECGRFPQYRFNECDVEDLINDQNEHLNIESIEEFQLNIEGYIKAYEVLQKVKSLL